MDEAICPTDMVRTLRLPSLLMFVGTQFILDLATIPTTGVRGSSSGSGTRGGRSVTHNGCPTCRTCSWTMTGRTSWHH